MLELAELVTERLRLRPVEATDVDALHALWTDAGVRRYLWDDEVIPRQRAAGVVEATTRDWREHGFGLWIAESSDGGALVGFCGFRAAQWDDVPELVFGLYPAYWGRGLATEAARAALAWAFRQPGWTRVVAATDVPNLASVRVLERLGMQPVSSGSLNDLPTLFYELSAGNFR